LLVRDAGLRSTLGANGKRYVEAGYSWRTIEMKYLDILNRYLSS
jgi:glycosyltransferase involved in cell wall biosynthesis